MSEEIILDIRYDEQLEKMDGIEVVNYGMYTVTYKIDTTKVVVDEKEEYIENSCEINCNNNCHNCANNDGMYISTIKISEIRSKKAPIIFQKSCLDQRGNFYNDYW